MKHKGVKIITEEAEKDVTFLVDVDPLFVSLVKHGANQQPFRVIKQDKTVDTTNQSALPKSVGFIDTNLGIDHAFACVDTFKTFFYIDGGGGFPSIQDNCAGDGFSGLIKVKDIGGVLDKDFVVITDCYYGRLADRRRMKNKKTFGPSELWADIENKRGFGWNKLKEMGVGVPDGKIVNGMNELLAYVGENNTKKAYCVKMDSAHKGRRDGSVFMAVVVPRGLSVKSADHLMRIAKQEDKDGEVFFIKVSEYRGNKETGGAVRNVTEALTAITQAGFGPYLTDLEILVQRKCPGIELGFDAYFNGKEFLRPFLYTIEEKGAGTVGVWTESNGIEQFIFDKIKPSLIATNYRGNISFEFFYDGIQIYAHDPTSRMPFPCSAIQAHVEKNHPIVLYRTAAGENCRVEIGKKYVAQVGVYTEDESTWRPILFPDELRPFIGFRRIVIREGEFYFVPGDNVVATAVGEGDTAKEAMENAMKVGMQIECSNSYVPADFVDITSKKIDKLNAMQENMRF